jgi:hypothetical protein
MAVSFGANYFLGRCVLPRIVYISRLDHRGQALFAHRPDDENERFIVTDPSGQVPSEFKTLRLDDYHVVDELMAPEARGDHPANRSYRHWNRFMVRHLNASRPGYEDWFYVPQRGRVFGYDRQSKRLLGSFGPDGFVASEGHSRDSFAGRVDHQSRFPEATAGHYLAFPSGVYTIDFRDRSVRALFAPADGETVLWASRWEDRKHTTSLGFVGTDKSVFAFDSSGRKVFTVPLAFEREQFRVERVGRLEGTDHFWIWYAPRWDFPCKISKLLPRAWSSTIRAAARFRGKLFLLDPVGPARLSFALM